MDELISWEKAVDWLKNQPDRVELVRSCYYDDPLNECLERFYLSSEWSAVQLLLKNIKPGFVLDMGAGRGISSYAFARDGWKVIALEPDTSDVVGTGAIKKIVCEMELPILIKNETGERIPYPDNTFDFVYTRQSLHHAANLNDFCKEAFRVLKNGGHFLATREHVLSKQKDLPVFLNNHPLHKLYGGENAYTLKTYKKAIKQAGFSIKKILKPYDSDINLFPSSKQSIRGEKYTYIPQFVFDRILKLYNLKNTPGRLYSFYCKAEK